MEDKGSFLSRLFKRREKSLSTKTAPSFQKQPTQETPSLSSFENRKQEREARNREQAQNTFTHQVDQAVSGRVVKSPPGTTSLQAKEESEKIAMTQTLKQASSVQEKFAPKGTPEERFKRLTQSQPNTEVPISSAPQKPAKLQEPTEESDSAPPFHPGTFPGVDKWQPGNKGEVLEEIKETPGERLRRLTQSQPNTEVPISSAPQKPAKEKTPPLQEITKPTLSERKTQKIDKATLAKSLQTPTSKWGKTKPPLHPGTFPGVDKWQPGKGAIKGEVLEEIKEEVKIMPKYPFRESEGEVEKNKPVDTPQKELKKAA